jgi:hypothetical protein
MAVFVRLGHSNVVSRALVKDAVVVVKVEELWIEDHLVAHIHLFGEHWCFERRRVTPVEYLYV